MSFQQAMNKVLEAEGINPEEVIFLPMAADVEFTATFRVSVPGFGNTGGASVGYDAVEFIRKEVEAAVRTRVHPHAVVVLEHIMTGGQ